MPQSDINIKTELIAEYLQVNQSVSAVHGFFYLKFDDSKDVAEEAKKLENDYFPAAANYLTKARKLLLEGLARKDQTFGVREHYFRTN